MAWNTKKVCLVAGGAVVGGAVCFITAGAAAPAVGAFVGSSFMGLSGCAATSAGLAAIGGGSVAAGGGGMAAGATLITTTLTASGATVGLLGAGTVANFMKDSNKEFEEALHQQKNFAKAQEIIKKQENKIRELKVKLADMRKQSDTNAKKIRQLSDLIEKLTAMVNVNKKAYEKAAA
jgi:hypothetical protein